MINAGGIGEGDLDGGIGGSRDTGILDTGPGADDSGGVPVQKADRVQAGGHGFGGQTQGAAITHHCQIASGGIKGGTRSQICALPIHPSHHILDGRACS